MIMAYPIVSHAQKFNCNSLWLLCFHLCILSLTTQAKIVPTVPQQVRIEPNSSAQQLNISWLGGAETSFNVLILRSELNTTVFNGTINATVSGWHQWTWTSDAPLECSSFSVHIRSKNGEETSDWSSTQISSTGQGLKMYPIDKVVAVGDTTTFCCILKKGQMFKNIYYDSILLNVTKLSPQSYAATIVHQEPTRSSGSNVVCYVHEDFAGTVVFVGYPPKPRDFLCETPDLTTAVCRWNEGRPTNLTNRRATRYSINNRSCEVKESGPMSCSFPQWDGNWTLLAVNAIGQYSLTDSANISHRVNLKSPVGLSYVAHAWNATLSWNWTDKKIYSIALKCEVQLTRQSDGHTKKPVFSGVGLRSVLLDLYPNENYAVQVRCGSQRHFWSWGKWSKALAFKTKPYVPDQPDVWMWMNKDNTGLVLWKPLGPRQSHGELKGYEITFWSPEGNIQHTEILSPKEVSLPVNLTQFTSFSNNDKITATVVARNDEGMSQPASVQLRLMDSSAFALSKPVYRNGHFDLSWRRDDNITCSYLLQWVDATCEHDCNVDWIRAAPGNTDVTIESANFRNGMRYNLSLYSCPSDSPELIQSWQGYRLEMVPSSSVPLSISQEGADVVLKWEEIPVAERRGFILGYNIYINNGTRLIKLANLSNPETRKYVVKDLRMGSYKFTVKAYTSAGEDSGTTVSILLDSPFDSTEGLILEILLALGIVTVMVVLASCLCYKKRKWVKKAFYPEIPEPKLQGDWSRTQGPLDMKPSPHSMVHIIENPERDVIKDTLVIIPEEEEPDDGERRDNEPLDTDEQQALRYYAHQVVIQERPMRPRFPDSSVSSSSSVDSANTDVTYTGIQTSCSSLVLQTNSQSSPGDFQPVVGHADNCGGYRPQTHQHATLDNTTDQTYPEPGSEPQPAGSGGFRPQSSWHLNSPSEADEKCSLNPSLGSPTSVASTQFLLNDGEEQEEERQQSTSAASWFSNLLSSAKQ